MDTIVNAFFEWENLISLTGCTAAVMLVTQMLKTPFKRVPTRFLSYLIAVVILIMATFFTHGLDFEAVCQILLNAALVAWTANGSFDEMRDFYVWIKEAKRLMKEAERDT